MRKVEEDAKLGLIGLLLVVLREGLAWSVVRYRGRCPALEILSSGLRFRDQVNSHLDLNLAERPASNVIVAGRDETFHAVRRTIY